MNPKKKSKKVKAFLKKKKQGLLRGTSKASKSPPSNAPIPSPYGDLKTELTSSLATGNLSQSIVYLKVYADEPYAQLQGLKNLHDKTKEKTLFLMPLGNFGLDQLYVSPQQMQEISKVVINSMRTHVGMASIQLMAFRVLLWAWPFATVGLAFSVIDHQQDAGAILSAMECHKENCQIQGMALKVLQKHAIQKKFQQAERLIEIVCTAIKNHPADSLVQVYAHVLLGGMVTGMTRQLRNEVIKLNCVALQAPWLRCNGMVQLTAAWCVGQILLNSSWEGKYKIPIESFRSLLATLKARKDLDGKALLALCTMALLDDQMVRKALEEDAATCSCVLQTVVKNAVATTKPTRNYLRSLTRLFVATLRFCPQSDVDIFYKDITAYTVCLMKECKGKKDVEVLGCRVLDALAERSKAAKAYIRHGEGDDVLFEAVRKCQTSEDVVFQAAGKLLFKLRD